MIVYSGHAKTQIRKRGISKRLISSAVRDPELVEQSYRGRLIRKTKVVRKTLEVVTITEGAKITVITAYYTKG